MPIMAQLGVGLLIIPQKPWDVVQQDLAVYHQVYREVNGTEAPPPLCVGFCFVDEHTDAGRGDGHTSTSAAIITQPCSTTR